MGRADDIEAYGFTAFPRDLDALLAAHPPTQPPAALSLADLPLPTSPLVRAIQAHAEAELPPPTFHHSMRVFHLGLAIARARFPALLTPSWTETYALAALLHDLGTTPTNSAATLLSFELQGALLALDVLGAHGAARAQAESVAEAVARHQDVGRRGALTSVCAVLQLATLLDNTGGHAELVDGATVGAVEGGWAREGWARCFEGVVRGENKGKPWGTTTRLGVEEFPRAVAGYKGDE